MMSKRWEACTDLLRYLHASGESHQKPSGHQVLWGRLIVGPLDSKWVRAGQCSACARQRQPKAYLHRSDQAHSGNDRVTQNSFVPRPPAGTFLMPAASTAAHFF